MKVDMYNKFPLSMTGFKFHVTLPFLSTGLSDHVRCHHCGSGLRNWEKEDDPWEEHARWYPECKYVLVKKGQEFIDKVRFSALLI